MKDVLIAVSTFAVASLVMAAPVSAQVAGQAQSQSLDLNTHTEVVCETGSYGQPVNCRATADASASATQSQRQYIRRADGTLIEVHRMVDTGLDTTGVLSMAGLLVSGSIAVFTKIKSRV